jgi:glycosyltransferase involved in cell wall biosynthesis
MKMKLFSIITCTFNSEKFIQENIESVLSQNYSNYEHIFIDGGSKDSTLKIIHKYYPKAKIFHYPPKGISNAMNYGTKHANGKYVIHLHSDDCFDNKNVLKNVSIFLEGNKYPDWIYGKIRYLDANNNEVGIFPNRNLFKKYFMFLITIYNYIPHQAVFIKKTLLEDVNGFEEYLKTAMDYSLWLELGIKKNYPDFIDIVCSKYRGHSSQQSQRISFYKNLINNFIARKRAGCNCIMRVLGIATDTALQFIVLITNRKLKKTNNNAEL